jgi:murein L,D-transpeptidase YafK
MLMQTLVLMGWLVWSLGMPGAPADPTPDSDLYYAVDHQATIYSVPDSSKPFVRLGMQEPVHLLARDDEWCEVKTMDGANGFVACEAISNVWIRVSKRNQRVHVYRGTELVRTIKADLGYNTFADKERRGSVRFRDHWRTPEGQFFVVRKNPNSQFYKAFVLNYPTARDAERGLKQGLISNAEHAAIVDAEKRFAMPPMNTELGGWIEIHGDGTGRATNWTQGCIAIPNRVIDALWSRVKVGTPVLIE